MNKRDFILLYPDVAKQEIEFKFVMAKKDVERDLLAMCNAMGTGLLAYQVSAKKAVAFTSVKFLNFKKRMVKDAVLEDLNGDKHVVVSEEPFMCGGEFCIRTECDDRTDVYACTFFNPNKQ